MDRDGQPRSRILQWRRSRASGHKRAEVFVDPCRRSARDDLREYLRMAIKAE
jgi:hypothetical protein